MQFPEFPWYKNVLMNFLLKMWWNHTRKVVVDNNINNSIPRWPIATLVYFYHCYSNNIYIDVIDIIDLDLNIYILFNKGLIVFFGCSCSC